MILKKQVPPSLEIVDIAGLVRGASEGAGLGNEFLSHIQAVDGIYHVVRVFDNEEITHVEGNIDAIRDMEIIHSELRLKDIDMLQKHMEPLRRFSKSDPTRKIEFDIYEKTLEYMKSGKDVRDGNWSTKEYELINELLLLCSKPIIYIVNMAQEDFERQKNRWLPRMKNWIQEHAPGAQMIPMSVAFEQFASTLSDQDRDNYLNEKKTKIMIPKIITTGFNSLHLINFFTVGTDEVKAWVLREGMTAPKAAGCIHTDFEKKFVRAEVMKYEELKELGSEQEVKARGKYYTEGKNYIVQDGDILLIKHAAGGGGKKK